MMLQEHFLVNMFRQEASINRVGSYPQSTATHLQESGCKGGTHKADMIALNKST